MAATNSRRLHCQRLAQKANSSHHMRYQRKHVCIYKKSGSKACEQTTSTQDRFLFSESITFKHKLRFRCRQGSPAAKQSWQRQLWWCQTRCSMQTGGTCSIVVVAEAVVVVRCWTQYRDRRNLQHRSRGRSRGSDSCGRAKLDAACRRENTAAS